MRHTIYILTLLFAYAAGLCANEPDSVLVEHQSLWRENDKASLGNPAIKGAAFSTSFSEIGLGFSYDHQSEPFVVEEGDGHTLTEIGVNTYLRLSKHSAVWGEAAYMNGTDKHKNWISTTDYRILQPYVLADSLGGDTKRERYYFSGAYASQVSDWLLGAEMTFRAEHEYRDQDPRMRGVVSDLNLRLGIGRNIAGNRVGVSLEGNVYKQTNDVDFYNEEGVIPEYQLTGLATVYTRFSGDKRTLYFNGGGMGLRLSSHPVGRRGLYADLCLSEHRYHRVLAEYNSMPLTDLYDESIEGTIGWKRTTDKSRAAVYLAGSHTRRTGDERIGGDASGGSYPIIARLTMYKNSLSTIQAGGIYGQKSWNCRLNAGYAASNESYAYPERKLNYSRLFAELVGQRFFAPTERLTLRVDAALQYIANIDSELKMPFADMSEIATAYINHKYDYAKANYASMRAGIRGDYKLRDSRFAIFGAIEAGATSCSTGESRMQLNVRVGATF